MPPPKEGMKYFKDFTRIEEMKKHENDNLKPLIKLTFYVLQYKIVKLCLIYVFCQYSFATILTIYHLVKTFDRQELLKHGSFCGIQVFVLLNLGAVIFLADDIFECMKSYRKLIIPFEIFEGELYKKIMAIVKIVIGIASINIVLAVIAAGGFILSPEYFNRKTYLTVWIRQVFPDYSNIMLLVVSFTSLPVALVLAGSPLAFTYGGTSGLIQLYMFNQCVSRICTSHIRPKFRRDSKIYQDIVRQKLKICIMLNVAVNSYAQIGNDIIEIPMYCLSVGSIILGGSLMIEFLSNQMDNIEGEYLIYVGIFCFTLAGIISTNLYIFFGQLIKDESERTNYILKQLPWYDMNRENKQLFSIFLLRTERPVTLSSNIVQIDFLLLVRIIRTLYSIAALLAQFVSLNS